MNNTIQIYGLNDGQLPSQEAHMGFCENYRRRDIAIHVVVQLNYLIREVQRHRGISMGLLAGNKAFEQDFVSVQKRIDRRLAMLEAYTANSDGVLPDRDKANVQLEWASIRHDWQGDKLSDNFELHCHFIEQLQQINMTIAKGLNTPIMGEYSAASSSADGEGETRKIELINFSCSLLPSLIETMAKVRGLSSFSAAMGSAEDQHERKLRFLLKYAREQNEKLHHCAQRLHQIINGGYAAKSLIGALETKFVHFLELVTHDVLSGTTIHSSSSQLFSLATDLIDHYWGIVDDGIDYLREWHRADMEAWISM